MKKKILAGLLAALMTIGLATFSASAEGAATGYELLYENTFDSGASGGIAALNKETEHFTLIATAKGGWNTVDFEGNTGVATNQGAWPSGRNICFDFTKGGTQAAVTSGIYRISYEFSPRVTGGGDTLWQGMNMPDHFNGGRLIRTYMTKEGTNEIKYLNVLATLGGWSGGATLRLEHELKYKVDIYLDITNKQSVTYVNNMLLGETVISGSMENFTINLCGYWDYFDNLILERYDSLPEFSVDIGEPEIAGMEFKATTAVKDWAEIAEQIEVKRIFDGKILTPQFIAYDLDNAVLTVKEGFEGGYNYEISLPAEIGGIFGASYALEKQLISANFGSENAAESVRLKSYDGEILPVESENRPELQSLVIEFTDDVSAENAMANVKIFDDGGSLVPFTAKNNANIGEAVFDGVLKENSEYTVKISGLMTEYSIVVKTTAGSIFVKSVALADADGNEITSLADVAAGDKVTAKLDIINTTDDEISYLATVTMQNGKLMTGVGFENTSVLPASKTVSEFDFTVGDKEGLSFTGLMWHQSKTAPLANSKSLVLK